ncbi:MAG: M48 family metalloprotease [Rhodocyclaceae bacterium]|jgi:predicted Zn-dependent protease|nr:M48 family metalloprotease [Rhodocyclaceae bacterium]
MRRALVGVRAVLLVLGLLGHATLAQAIEINLGKVFDAAKSVAQSRQVANLSEPEEVTLGDEIASRTLSAYPLVDNEPLQRYVNSVGRWVALQSERPSLPWRFALAQSDQMNAFAVPGGVVLITSAMWMSLQNEAELACVIGHEVAHIVRKHHLALLEQGALIEAGKNLIDAGIQGGSGKDLAKRMALGEGAELFTRKLDRGAERDADADGVVYAARAGYDPAACLSFIQRMAARKVSDSTLGSLYKTHPQASERVVDVTDSLTRLIGAQAGSGALPPIRP